jgi:S-formylglutathione hydrolase FrmB
MHKRSDHLIPQDSRLGTNIGNVGANLGVSAGFTWYKNSWDGRIPVETMLIEELIPHVDATYPTIAGAHGRCIEGYSMGGRGSTRLAMKYPHLFCSLHNQAGNVLNLAMMGGQHDGDGRGIAPGWDGNLWESYLGGYLGPEKWRYEEAAAAPHAACASMNVSYQQRNCLMSNRLASALALVRFDTRVSRSESGCHYMHTS